MSDPHVTAIATIVQDVLLLANAFLVAWYLLETRKMRQAAEKQVRESQELVKTGQQQLTVSQEQIRISLQEAEAEISPSVAIRRDRKYERFLAENVGNGPAIDLKFVSTADRATIQWDALPNVSTALNGAFLPVGERPPEDVVVPLAGGPDQELQIMYKSLSGKQYFTVIRFDRDGRPVETLFDARR